MGRLLKDLRAGPTPLVEGRGSGVNWNPTFYKAGPALAPSPMQALTPRDREVMTRRRSRVGCPVCGQFVDLTRLRGHLRERHQMESGQLDRALTEARRSALRGRSRSSGYSGL
jgi:hypothetical protein